MRDERIQIQDHGQSVCLDEHALMKIALLAYLVVIGVGFVCQ